MRNKYLYLFLFSNILIILDQLTKLLVTLHIPKHYSLKVIDGFFSLTHIRNPGVAFGLFSEGDPDIKAMVFIAFSTVAILAILVFFHNTPASKKSVLVGLILIFSGAIGNLIDRIQYQEVVDFLDFQFGNYHWPAFNIADSCITIGVVFLVIDLVNESRAHRPGTPSDSA